MEIESNTKEGDIPLYLCPKVCVNNYYSPSFLVKHYNQTKNPLPHLVFFGGGRKSFFIFGNCFEQQEIFGIFCINSTSVQIFIFIFKVRAIWPLALLLRFFFRILGGKNSILPPPPRSGHSDNNKPAQCLLRGFVKMKISKPEPSVKNELCTQRAWVLLAHSSHKLHNIPHSTQTCVFLKSQFGTGDFFCTCFEQENPWLSLGWKSSGYQIYTVIKFTVRSEKIHKFFFAELLCGLVWFFNCGIWHFPHGCCIFPFG